MPADKPAVAQRATAEHRLPDLAKVSQRRVAATAAADLSARVATVMLGIVTTALLARHLGVSGFAAMNYALAWGLLFAPLTDFGLRQAAVNRLSVRTIAPSEIAGSVLLLRMIMSVVFAAIAAILAIATAPDATVALGSLIVCVGMLFSSPGILVAVIQTAMKPSWVIVSNAVSSLGWTVMALLLIAFDAGPVVLVAGSTVVGIAASLVAAWMATRLTTIGRPSRAAVMSLLRLSIPLGLGAIAVVVYYRVASILVYQIAGPDEAGYYTAAFRLVDQIQIVPVAIVGALFPLMSEAAVTDPARLQRLVAATWEILLGIALPVVAIGMAVAHPLAGLLFGADFRGPTGDVIIVIWPVVIAIFLGYLGGALVPAINIVRIWILIAFAGAGINLALNAILIPQFGADGAAVATLATEFPVMIATLWIAARRAHLSLPWSRVVRMGLVAAIAGLTSAALLFMSLIPAVVGGAAAYVLGLHVLRVIDLRSLSQAVRHPRELVRSIG